MIALVLVIGIAVALSVAGWVSLVRGALGTAGGQASAQRAAVTTHDADPVTEAVSA